MKKRIPIVAFLMSFIFWGFGQIYNTNLKLGFSLFFLMTANSIFAMTLIPFSYPRAIQILYGIIIIMLMLGNAVHAFIEAKKIKEARLTKFNNIFFYVGFVVFYLIFLQLVSFIIAGY